MFYVEDCDPTGVHISEIRSAATACKVWRQRDTTNSNAVVVMQEKTITNAAAAVLEGGVKPESSLVFEQKTEPVRKIATWVPASEESLEDVAGCARISTRLSLFVRLEDEDQLVNGNGTAPNLLGILARPGLGGVDCARRPPNLRRRHRRARRLPTGRVRHGDRVGVMTPLQWRHDPGRGSRVTRRSATRVSHRRRRSSRP